MEQNVALGQNVDSICHTMFQNIFFLVRPSFHLRNLVNNVINLLAVLSELQHHWSLKSL
jgi:hypothetical protein